MNLREHAVHVRENAYAPYSGFKVGAAIEVEDGTVFTGVNVENVAYPEGTCAEAGAIAAMVARGGAAKIRKVYVVADADTPVTPCGGCRQKLAEFCAKDAQVTMGTLDGIEMQMSMADLLPGAFSDHHMDRADT